MTTPQKVKQSQEQQKKTKKQHTHKEESCKCFCRPLPGTEHHSCCPRAHQTGQKGTENIILSSYSEERDCSMTDPFSMELKDALKKVKTRKALGSDWIIGEMLKHLGACSRAVLLKIFNHSWMKWVVPAVWKEAVIIPVPKKGKDKKNPRNYRPISLLSCAGKLLERLVNRRLISHLESSSVLSPTQTSYRKFRTQKTNLPTLPRTSKMHSRRKRRFWQSSSISQMHFTRSWERDCS